jgi:tetratricopeptide (TPR) repeat protein
MLRQNLKTIEKLAQSDNYSEAWSRLEILVSNNPKEEALIWRTRAYIHSREGDDKAAISDLDRSIFIFEKEPHPYYTRGIIYFQIGQFKNAVCDFSKVIELCDYYKSDYYRESAYFLRADAYVRLEDFEKAIADCAHVSDDFQTWTDKIRTKNDILAECKK